MKNNFFSPAKNLFAAALLALSLFSCSKKDYLEPAPGADDNAVISERAIAPEDTMWVTPGLPIPQPVDTNRYIHPSKQQVTSFTLVNAATQKDIMTLSPDATISLSEIRASRVNFRVNLANGTATVVKINLISGTDNRERYEDSRPYAVFGDESGRYNGWYAKPGRYNLKATPHAGTRNKVGDALGAEYSLYFTIVR
ncbi:hypothetical protein V9K67_23730 [Paraflavisolibacter sp. H34]|uniref:hypothetical protein n=1 Tax=Huijunlia imazamoxiresistens TaxID=3127457 RepID=UPI00301AF994